MKHVCTVIAKHARLYHPEMYREGDELTVFIKQTCFGNWQVIAFNDKCQRVNRMLRTTGHNEQYARRVARWFADTL